MPNPEFADAAFPHSSVSVSVPIRCTVIAPSVVFIQHCGAVIVSSLARSRCSQSVGQCGRSGRERPDRRRP